jgi:fatty-acyl-CoA synthase
MAAAIGSPDAYAGEVPVVYVQAKPGASVEEQELLEFAARRIPERAAVPKHVRIVHALPVTSVGKIFKPALLQREAESVIRSEAEAAGAVIVNIEIEQDLRSGQLFQIRVASGADSLRRALERYTLKFAVSEQTVRAGGTVAC